jgi:hypothetical protein
MTTGLKIYNSSVSQVSSTSTEMTVDTFIGMLFHFRTALHFAHLNVAGSGAYAAHAAFGELYKEVENTADILAEISQCERLLNLCSPEVCTPNVGKKTVEELITYIETNKYVFTKSNEQNEIDNLVTAAYKAKYKLNKLQ